MQHSPVSVVSFFYDEPVDMQIWAPLTGNQGRVDFGICMSFSS